MDTISALAEWKSWLSAAYAPKTVTMYWGTAFRFLRDVPKPLPEITEADVARSLLAGTARILRHTLEQDADISRGGWREMLLSGGGANNPVLVEEVRACFPEQPVRVARSGAFAPEHHEPAAMALFAARTMARLPSSLPKVTGARGAAILGHVHWPSA
jgi:anhydro-N-acetylmuramic acid kinase